MTIKFTEWTIYESKAANEINKRFRTDKKLYFLSIATSIALKNKIQVQTISINKRSFIIIQ